jgi:hypothetical protein
MSKTHIHLFPIYFLTLNTNANYQRISLFFVRYMIFLMSVFFLHIILPINLMKAYLLRYNNKFPLTMIFLFIRLYY